MKYLFVFLILSFSIHSFGQDTTTVIIGDLEIMTEDLGKMNWDDAKKACADLGDGWRLPTKDELKILYENREKIGGFANIYLYYWSSTESNTALAYVVYFTSQNCGEDNYFKTNTYSVRAVRSF